MISESGSGTVLYACVSHGPTVLADHILAGIFPAAAGGGGSDLAALAATCLEAAPRYHLLYTHTASRRIYAFLMADPVLFFAIAEESLGRSAVLMFLHRLRDATLSSAQRRVDAGDPLPHHCLQEEILPILRRLMASFSTNSATEEEKLSPSLPPLLPSPFLSSTTPPSSDSHLLTGEHKRKIKKERKKNARNEEGVSGSRGGDELDISVLGSDGDADFGLGLNARKSLHRIWRQQVRMVLVIDAVVCILLFGIWLSVCKGLQCMGR